MNDFETTTILADDGSHLTIWDVDSCPLCGGHLVTVQGGGLDQVYCLGCHRYADQEA